MNTKNSHTDSSVLPPPPLHRRLIAMFYDFAVTSTSILIITLILISFISPNENIAPLSPLANMLFALQLFLNAFYFIALWLKKDATLGMSVWKLRITGKTGHKITIMQAIMRYTSVMTIMIFGFTISYQVFHFGSGGSTLIAFLFLGLSLMWSLFNPHKLALHEQLSQTKLVDIREINQSEQEKNQGNMSP